MFYKNGFKSFFGFSFIAPNDDAFVKRICACPNITDGHIIFSDNFLETHIESGYFFNLFHGLRHHTQILR